MVRGTDSGRRTLWKDSAGPEKGAAGDRKAADSRKQIKPTLFDMAMRKSPLQRLREGQWVRVFPATSALPEGASSRTRTLPSEWKEPPVAVLASFMGFCGRKRVSAETRPVEAGVFST